MFVSIPEFDQINAAFAVLKSRVEVFAGKNNLRIAL